MGGLERRMRDRWQTIISGLWDANKTEANKLNLVGQLDYYGKLSAQFYLAANPWLKAAPGSVRRFGQAYGRRAC